MLRFSPAKRKTRASKFWGRPDCSRYKRAVFLAVTSNWEPVFLGGTSSGPNGGRRGSANISEVTVVEKSSVTEQKVELRPAGLPGLLMSPFHYIPADSALQSSGIYGINDSSVLLSYLFILSPSSNLDHPSFLDETE